jgi:hypothetical protein
VGKKSEMNQYLNDMLADSLHHSGRRFRDDHHHPFIFDVLTAGNVGRPTFNREFLSSIDEWAEGCTELFETLPVQNLISSLSTCDIKEEGCYDILSRPRKTSSFPSEVAVCRSRSLSCASDQELKKVETREGTLDLCIKKTANMDLSTSELAKEKSVWLAKEIRGVRKKLNQIKKLQDLDKTESTVLSIDERTKVDRRPAFEAEICVYESALEEVEERIRELVLEEQSRFSEAKQSEKQLEQENGLIIASSSNPGIDVYEEKTSLGKKTSSKGKQVDKAFECNVCGIKCPDQTSYELHKSGRKHRNRLSQVTEEEKTKAADSIMKQCQAEKIKESSLVARTQSVPKQMKKAWGSKSSIQPKFILPPPPHPTVTQVSITSPSSPWQNNWSNPSLSRATSQITKASLELATFTNVSKKRANKAEIASTKRAGLSPGHLVWSSSPDSSRCVPLNIYSSPPSTPSVPLEQEQRSSYSLADFLAPKPDPNGRYPGSKTWSSPQAKAPVATKTFAEIQAEEIDFKSRQDKSYEKGGGTWFLERRERANSLREIQNSARKEQEEREFIEEQKRIEVHIHKEVALHRTEQSRNYQAKKKCVTPKKKSKSNKKTSNKGKSNGQNGDYNTSDKGRKNSSQPAHVGEGRAAANATTKKDQVGDNTRLGAKPNKTRSRRNLKRSNKKSPDGKLKNGADS